MSDFLKREDIICRQQFGFRSGLSTSDAILEFTNKCTDNLNNKLYTIAVFLDLSRAFDTCNKEITIKKLERLGFRGVVANWFRSYLTDRKMFVNVFFLKGSPARGTGLYLN